MEELKVRRQWPLMKTVIVWFALIALLFAALFWFRVLTLPAWLTLERRAFTHSHQYVESKRAAIARYVAECATLPPGPQRRVLRQRIAAEVALLPVDVHVNTGGCR